MNLNVAFLARRAAVDDAKDAKYLIMSDKGHPPPVMMVAQVCSRMYSPLCQCFGIKPATLFIRAQTNTIRVMQTNTYLRYRNIHLVTDIRVDIMQYRQTMVTINKSLSRQSCPGILIIGLIFSQSLLGFIFLCLIFLLWLPYSILEL